MQLTFLCMFIGVLMPVITTADDLNVLYFKPVSLDCNLADHNISEADVKNRYWMLPDGRLVEQPLSEGRLTIDPDYTLNITKVDDIDFGRYSCLVVLSNFTIILIKHGVNVDGPYFGDLLSKYRKNAIIGGIAAGSLFLVLAVGCMLWNFRYHKRSQKNKVVDDLDKAIDGYDLKDYDNVGLETDTAVTHISTIEGTTDQL